MSVSDNSEAIKVCYENWLHKQGKKLLRHRINGLNALASIRTRSSFTTEDFLDVWESPEANLASAFRFLKELVQCEVLTANKDNDETLHWLFVSDKQQRS
ncbi:hypothetical protein CGZ80_09965 [Rhodopirellula sp. MGV]|nr:hypothetical protein CGZ80_09965 [Rhodopirellula sp. MGV]PNY36579.1 hypothetical protein C2E31_12040 [Rhodopirellula baltica]